MFCFFSIKSNVPFSTGTSFVLLINPYVIKAALPISLLFEFIYNNAPKNPLKLYPNKFPDKFVLYNFISI